MLFLAAEDVSFRQSRIAISRKDKFRVKPQYGKDKCLTRKRRRTG